MNANFAALTGAVNSALYVFDGNGVPVGRYFDGAASSSFQIFDEANEVLFEVGPQGDLAPRLTTMYFASTDCTGAAYFHGGQTWTGGFLYGIPDGRLFATENVQPTQPYATVSISSRFSNVCAEQPPEDTPVYPGREVFLSLSFPLAEVLYVALLE